MDVTPFKKRIPLLLQRLKCQNYSSSWYSRFNVECNELVSSIENYETMEDYIDDVRSKACNGLTAWQRINCIRSIVRYVYDNKLPKPKKNKSTYSLTPYYEDVLNFGLEKVREAGLSTKTWQNYLDTMTTFFLHLESLQINNLDEVSEDVVLSYFDGDVKRGHTTSRLILRFIKYIESNVGEERANKLSHLIPRVQKHHRIYRGLTQSERAQVEFVILNGHINLTDLDRAICALAFYTGMRACDIINLRFSNIDWDKNLISIIQVKTHKELSIRLLPCYGNPIYRYLISQRPKVRDNHIFLRPGGSPMNTHDTYRCTIKLLHAAGINIDGRTRGIHLLRHSLATTLIEHDTNYAVVTATLGHKSARATYTYLSSETESLRKCCINSEDNPINDNYFQL